jgi:hypothetical protein
VNAVRIRDPFVFRLEPARLRIRSHTLRFEPPFDSPKAAVGAVALSKTFPRQRSHVDPALSWLDIPIETMLTYAQKNNPARGGSLGWTSIRTQTVAHCGNLTVPEALGTSEGRHLRCGNLAEFPIAIDTGIVAA